MSADALVSYAALILADAEVEISSDKLIAITKAAGSPVEQVSEGFWGGFWGGIYDMNLRRNDKNEWKGGAPLRRIWSSICGYLGIDLLWVVLVVF